MRVARVPNRSMDSAGEADSTFENNKASLHPNLNTFTLFRPRMDRRIHTAPGKYSNSPGASSLYLAPSQRSRSRVLIGQIIFSRVAEKLILALIIVFAVVVLASVALRDELGKARVCVVSVQLGILAAFEVELLCKVVAVGTVRAR